MVVRTGAPPYYAVYSIIFRPFGRQRRRTFLPPLNRIGGFGSPQERKILVYQGIPRIHIPASASRDG